MSIPDFVQGQVVYAYKTHFWRNKGPNAILTNAADDLVFLLIY